MAETIVKTGTFYVTVNGTTTRWTGDSSVTYTKTGSNATADVKDLPVGVWVALNTSSLSNLYWGFFDNISTGSIAIANTTSSMPMFTISPGNTSDINFGCSTIGSPSGSLWAKATDSASVLSYIVSEN